MPPGILSFRFPLSKINRNGTLKMLNLDARIGLASTFSFPTRTLPFDSTPNWSITGATAPQLGHQGAHAHISTGKGDFNTMFSKLPSLIIIGCGVNNSSVFNIEPHLPHFAPAFNFAPGTLFFAPHSVHRILKLSLGRALCSSVDRASWHLPHLAVLPTRSTGILLAAPHSGHLIMCVSVCAIIVLTPC